jgi:hypothetical protein
MRILLDECMPRRLRRELPGHEVITVQEAGWAGRTNGELLRLAERQFDAFITVDRGIGHQQPLTRLNIAVIILAAPSNRLGHLRPLMPAVAAALEHVRPGHVVGIGIDQAQQGPV